MDRRSRAPGRCVREGLSRVLLFVGLLLCVSGGAAAQDFQPDERSVSASGQFYVYGSDAEARSLLASTAESLRRGVVRLLAMRGESHAHPIVITLSRKEGIDDLRPEAALNLYNTEGGLKLQLDFVFDRRQPKVDLAVEIVRAILLEIAAADLRYLPENTPYALPPDWLAYGVVEWFRVDDSGAPPPVFSGMLEARIPFHELLSHRYLSLDSTSRQLYRAYGYCLIQLLISQNQGRAGLRKLVKNCPSHPLGGLEMLSNYFPELTESGESLDKWWLLSVAKLAKSGESGALSVRQTEARLASLLEVPVMEEGKEGQLQLEDYRKIAKLPNRETLLMPVKTRLLQLSGEASPMYFPVLQEYDLVVTQMMAGKTKEIDEHLAKLGMLRELILKRDEEIEDYLNWYEATQPSLQSHSFDGFIETADAGPEKAPVERNDSISLYLDSLERELR